MSQDWQAIGNQSPPGVPASTGSPWRPSQWSTGKQLTSITVSTPAQQRDTSVVSHTITQTGQSGSTTTPGSSAQGTSTTYFFDAVISADHYTALRLTDHPIQSGASIVDHAYYLPARVVLEIGMSDAMDSFVHGQYASQSSKSVSAYQKFVELQKSRRPLSLSTRLQQYENMLIEDIRAADTSHTVKGLRATIVLRQIILANLATDTVSARPDQSQNTNEGSVQTTTVPDPVTNTHTTPFKVPPLLPMNPKWSSDPHAPFNLGDQANVPPQ